jgi:palmitoyltransferase
MQDHHCPWLNACVGLGNERHFVLFMLWLAFGMGVVVCTSYPLLKRSFALSTPVSHSAVSPAK